MRRVVVVGLTLACLLAGLTGRALAQQKTSRQREVEECIEDLKTSRDVSERKYAITRLKELETTRRGLAKDATPGSPGP